MISFAHSRQGAAVTKRVVAGFGDFGDGVGFGMEDVRLCRTGLVLTLVFKSGRSAVVAV